MRTRLLPVALLSVLALAAAAESETTTIVLERLDGTYTDLGGGVREVRNGPVTVRPTSPSNRFELLAHRLELTPLGEGVHQADFWVRFEGEADVEAEILMGPLSGGTLTDQVTVPEQERTINTRVKIERQEENYLITIVEVPDAFSIHVQSQLAGRLVSICETLTRFTFGSKCDGLDAALSNPQVPMPEPGEELVLESGQLTIEEAAELDAYLASGAQAPGPSKP